MIKPVYRFIQATDEPNSDLATLKWEWAWTTPKNDDFPTVPVNVPSLQYLNNNNIESNITLVIQTSPVQQSHTEGVGGDHITLGWLC